MAGPLHMLPLHDGGVGATMNAPLIVEDVIRDLQKRFGKPTTFGHSRLLQFGSLLACSVNYSKLLRGQKFFFGLAKEVADPKFHYPTTVQGNFVVLVCGSPDQVLVIPRSIILEMLKGVPTRKLDVFCENDAFILQTTQHPKLNVTEFLNTFPKSDSRDTSDSSSEIDAARTNRTHVKMQWALIQLGRAEGCSVWVPPPDRNLSYERKPLRSNTIDKLPNFGFEENTRRIVHNIDVLWLRKNVIMKAFEIEATTLIYSGLLRLNDLVLAQPNNHVALYIVSDQKRRQHVFNQLIRPSFHQLIPKCEFVSFDFVEKQLGRLAPLQLDPTIRVSGLMGGERFELPEQYVYPTGV
jgi:hypothetical protein